MLHRTKRLNVEVSRIITFYGSLSRSSTLYHLRSSDRINYRRRKVGIRLRREKDILPSTWAVGSRTLRVHTHLLLMDGRKQKKSVHHDLQVTSLISEQPSNKKKGRSKRAHLLVANVIQATENFINKAGEIAHENPDMRNDLLQSMDEVKRTGEQSLDWIEFLEVINDARRWRNGGPIERIRRWSMCQTEASTNDCCCTSTSDISHSFTYLGWSCRCPTHSQIDSFGTCRLLVLLLFVLFAAVDRIGWRWLTAYSRCLQSRGVGSFLQAIWQRYCWLESTCTTTSTGNDDRIIAE